MPLTDDGEGYIPSFDKNLVDQARSLVSEHGENPEYDRALVELVIRLTPGASHDAHTQIVRDLIGVKA